MEKHTVRGLELVADQATSGVIITDPSGITVWVNKVIEKITGYAARELIGYMPGHVLQDPGTRYGHIDVMRHAIRQRKHVSSTVANYTKSGTLYWCHMSCCPFYKDDGELEGFIGTLVDVTRVQRLASFNAMHAAVNHAIAQSDDDLGLMQSICDLAVRHANLELAWIGRPDANREYQYLARSGRSVAYLDNFMISIDPDIPEGQGPSGQTWRDGVPTYSQSFSTNPTLMPWQERARSFGLDASATMPIFRNGDIWAVFTVYHARPGIFDEELCRVLDTLASDISHGLDQIDLRAREHELANQLYQEKELAQVTLSSIQNGIVTTDASGCITLFNPKAAQLSGWPGHEAAGRPLADVLEIYPTPESRQRMDPTSETLQARASGSPAMRAMLVSRDGTRHHVDIATSPIFTREDTVRGCVLIIHDVTERLDADAKLEWQAHHDGLTGLPNRLALETRLQACLHRARDRDTRVAIGLLDLDDFKPVNDQHGHEAGDRILVELAQRLQARLRPGDFLARLAGDEIVAVIDNLDPVTARETLKAALTSLHRAIETPFEPSDGKPVTLGMSMGVAIYPSDGEDVDALIRQADLAMYAAKANKYNRPNWWRPAMLSLSDRVKDEPIDPYGQVAGELLGKTLTHWAGIENEFVEAFYARLMQLPSAQRVLRLLSEPEQKHLRKRQAEHFKQLISPVISQDWHVRASKHLGRIHAMLGVENSDIMAAMGDYGKLLRYASQNLPWRVDARLALDSIMQSRLANEIQFQCEGRDAIEHTRFANLSGLEARARRWVEEGNFASRLADHLCTMQGIGSVLIGRPDIHDDFILEFKAGECISCQQAHLAPEALSSEPATYRMPDWRRAWVNGQIVVNDHLDAGPQAGPTPESAGPCEARSAVYLPILDNQGHSIIMVAMFGQYPGQFSSATMRVWLESVQHTITPAFWRAEKKDGAPIDNLTRQHYHELLFTDHLQIVVQPIVTLSTGTVEKVEVLARLRDGDRLLTPADFLPSFGKQDLKALFRKELRQVMQWMALWDKQGTRVSVNLNLPPSVLISPHCADWVEEELKASQVEPARLNLELLESEDDAGSCTLRDAAIARLDALGVRLVMDDLGSGYSSLHRMRTLPFTSVKVDQELVKYATSEPERTIPFIGSLVRMAQSIDLEVVVEGLEDIDMIDMATRLGADQGQGYAISRPFLPDNLSTWVRQWETDFHARKLDTRLGSLATDYLGSLGEARR